MVAQKQNLRTIKASGSDARAWSGRQYPDGSFSIGAVPPEKKRKAEKEYDQDWRATHEIVEWSEKDASEYQGYSDKVAYRTKDDKIDRYLTGFNRPSELSHQKKRYGKNGITSYGKRQVRSGSALLERRYGKERLGFMTATLPSANHGLDAVELYYLAENWAKVTRRFCDELRRELERQQAPTEIICVTEIQEKRFRNRGEVAPHLHIVFVAKSAGRRWRWYMTAECITNIWNRTLRNFLGDDSQFTGSGGSVDVKRVRKSATRYISKYMSKGGKILSEIQEQGLESCLPSQWWSAYGGLRKIIKNNILNLTQKLIKKYLSGIQVGSPDIMWSRDISIELPDGAQSRVGVAGGVRHTAYERWTGIPWDSPIWE